MLSLSLLLLLCVAAISAALSPPSLPVALLPREIGAAIFSERGEKSKAERAIPEVSGLILAHIILMSIAFFVFLPIALFFAVFRFHPKLWFRMHLIFNTLALLTAVAGFVIIVVEVDRRNVSQFAAIQDSPTRGTHPMLGLIIMFLAVVQVVLGLAANFYYRKRELQGPPIVRTPVIAKVHKFLGRLIFLTVIAEVFLGVREALLPDWVYGVYGGYIGGVLILAILMHSFRSLSHWRTLLYHEKLPVASSPRSMIVATGEAGEEMFPNNRIPE